MRFFFDTNESGRLLRDDDGVELPSAQAAENEALAALGEIAKDELPKGKARFIEIQVRDERGTVLLTAVLTFQVERRF